MRPTDFCHLNDLRAPVPRAFPAHSAAFTACVRKESWAPSGWTGGPSVSRHSRTLRRIAAGHALPLASCLSRTVTGVGGKSVGVIFPRRPLRSSL